MSLMRTCTKCFLKKPEEEFGWKNRLIGKRHAVCKECTKKRSNDWYYDNKERQVENVRQNNIYYRERNKEYILDYLSTHPCTRCGETDVVVLEFHHVRGQKEADITAMMGRGFPLEKIIAEIKKCDVVCANCHRRITTEERGWFKGRAKK